MTDSILINRQRHCPVPLARLKQFLRRLKQRLRLSDKNFTVLLTSDRGIRELNRQYRGKDAATDVLSFPLGSTAASPVLEPDYLGDIAISVEAAQRQATVGYHALDAEIRILMIHGLLHLLGYDHEADRGRMRRKELKLRRDLLC